MGNQVAVEENAEDWFASDYISKVDPRCYPRKFKQYLHVWRCESEISGLETVKTTAINIDERFLFNNKESYIIIHVRYPLTVVVNERKDIDAKELDLQKLIDSIATSINPATTKYPLIGKYDNKFKSVSSPYYEAHVWNGNEATTMNAAVAIVKAHLFDQLLVKIVQTGGTLRTYSASEFIPISCDFENLKEYCKSLKHTNSLIQAILENIQKHQHVSNDARKFSLPSSTRNKVVSYSSSKVTGNIGMKSFTALVPSLEGIASTRPEHHRNDERGLKQEKLQKYIKICSKITTNLYLAGEEVSTDRNVLLSNKISHIVNCAGTICTNRFVDDFTYFTMYLFDSKNEDVSCFFLLVLDFVNDAVKDNGSVLFHCQQGVSRSSAMLIMYLMWKNMTTFDETHKKVKEMRGISNPNTGFIFQLLLWEKRLGIRSAPIYPWVMYVIPHSAVDPIFIVRNVDPKFSAFDPRGVFLIQTKDVLYKWIGSASDKRLLIPSDQYVCRLQKYMQAPETCIEIHQGSEPEEFCKILGGVPSTTEKSQYNAGFALLSELPPSV